MTFWDENVLLG